MKSMKVLLRQKVEHLGGIGDIVSVAPGYARNYLLQDGHAGDRGQHPRDAAPP